MMPIASPGRAIGATVGAADDADDAEGTDDGLGLPDGVVPGDADEEGPADVAGATGGAAHNVAS